MKIKLKNYKKPKKLKNKSLKQQAEILENISIFLERGYSLLDTLQLLQYRYDLKDYIKMLEEGYLVSEILKVNNFDHDILLVVEIAEKSGDLKLGIKNSYLIIKQKLKNKNDLMQLLKYPIILMMIIFLALGFVSGFLIPQFKNIYQSFNLGENKTMDTLFLIIEILPFSILIIVCFLLILLFFFSKKSEEKKLEIILKNKILSKYYINLYNQIFVINIVNLMKIGLRIDQIFIILSEQKYNKLLQKEAKRILKELEDGKQLYETIQHKYYVKELIMLIKEGETFSTLLHNLENYMIFLQQKNDKKTKKIFLLIQPIFYGLFGILIVLLYSAIFIPMFSMMESI